MTATTLPTPADLSITPRDRRFGREAAAPRLWHGGRVEATAIYNALSSTFPIGRGLFRRERPRVPRAARRPSSPRRSRHSPRRKRSTAASMTRSTSARRAPATTCRSSRRRSRSGWRSPAGSRRSSVWRRPWRSSISPRSWPTSCSPNPGISPAPTGAADLWRWHAVEEIEHKGVAYDTWLYATRDWPRCKRWKVKAKVMLYVTRNFVVDRTAGALELMRQDGVTGLSRMGDAALVPVGAARHVPQDRRCVGQVLPSGLPPVERGRPPFAACL